ncbi:unnamed protein product [Phytomonas sp. EM1]|nr:unnamed protein product [Phytomonas sp. EM1]|eukprot:CCW63295.1 unnamed protein product [Phytomonas sp. isolate EM1]
MSLKKTSPSQRVLDESQILISTKQYDIELLYHANLSQMAIASLGVAFRRCYALTALDLSRNMLPSLDGIQDVAATLVFLNASENCIRDLAHLRGFAQLERVWLEGNQLSNKASIAPLAELKSVKELWLRREASMKLSANDTSCMVLDNPICSDSKAYALLCRELFPHVRSLDGSIYRHEAAEDDTALAKVSTVDECAASFRQASERIKKEVLEESMEEFHLLRLLKTSPK